MNLKSNHFGNIEIDEKDLIDFPAGMIGFSNENKFILIRQRENSPIAWLHSITNPALAFPVISLEALAVEYGEDAVTEAARAAGISGGPDSWSIMLVFAAPGRDVPPTVNLVAPVIVDSETRTGAQMLLEGTKYTACEPLSTWLASEPPAQTTARTPVRRPNEATMAMEER
jgi:flagellar assembly factor FliW